MSDAANLARAWGLSRTFDESEVRATTGGLLSLSPVPPIGPVSWKSSTLRESQLGLHRVALLVAKFPTSVQHAPATWQRHCTIRASSLRTLPFMSTSGRERPTASRSTTPPTETGRTPPSRRTNESLTDSLKAIAPPVPTGTQIRVGPLIAATSRVMVPGQVMLKR